MKMQIANAIVQVYARYAGRGPTRARASLYGDSVVCLLGEVLTPLERTLVAGGYADLVRTSRAALHDVVHGACEREIERITGLRVRHAVTEIDTDTDVAVAVFALDGRGST